MFFFSHISDYLLLLEIEATCLKFVNSKVITLNNFDYVFITWLFPKSLDQCSKFYILLDTNLCNNLELILLLCTSLQLFRFK